MQKRSTLAWLLLATTLIGLVPSALGAASIEDINITIKKNPAPGTPTDFILKTGPTTTNLHSLSVWIQNFDCPNATNNIQVRLTINDDNGQRFVPLPPAGQAYYTQSLTLPMGQTASVIFLPGTGTNQINFSGIVTGNFDANVATYCMIANNPTEPPATLHKIFTIQTAAPGTLNVPETHPLLLGLLGFLLALALTAKTKNTPTPPQN